MEWREEGGDSKLQKLHNKRPPYFVLVAKYYWDNNLKKHEMGGAFSDMVELRHVHEIFVAKPEKKRLLRKPRRR